MDKLLSSSHTLDLLLDLIKKTLHRNLILKFNYEIDRYLFYDPVKNSYLNSYYIDYKILDDMYYLYKSEV